MTILRLATRSSTDRHSSCGCIERGSVHRSSGSRRRVDDLSRSFRLAGSASMKAFMSFCGSPASVGEKGICRSVSSASTSALLIAAAASSLMPPPAGSRSLTVASSRSSRSSESPRVRVRARVRARARVRGRVRLSEKSSAVLNPS